MFSRDSTRSRIGSSPLTVEQTQGLLELWMKEADNRDVSELLSSVATKWTEYAMPHPRELCQSNLVGLGLLFAKADHFCNPKYLTLLDAQLACNLDEPCLYGKMLAKRLAGDNSKLIRLVLSKYRKIALYPIKRDGVFNKCTSVQKRLLGNFVKLIAKSDASQHAIADLNVVAVPTPSPQFDQDFADMESFLASPHTNDSPQDSGLRSGSSFDSIQSSAMLESGSDFADMLALVGYDVEEVSG